jgi:hypothetical protein
MDTYISLTELGDPNALISSTSANRLVYSRSVLIFV